MDNLKLTDKKRQTSPKLNKQRDVDETAVANVTTIVKKPLEKDAVQDTVQKVPDQEDHSLVPRREHEGN